MKRFFSVISIVLVIAGFLVSQASASPVTTLNGTWASYPGQQAIYQTLAQQPINADGSSNFKAKANGVIPLKFALSEGQGDFVFESIGSDSNLDNDYSFVSFTPATPVTFNEITELSAVYAFTLGDCYGGALRWAVRVSPTASVFIYYGALPSFVSCTDTADQSGVNLLNLSDARFDLSQVGGPWYGTYSQAQQLVGNQPIIRASLVLDGGSAGDQRLTLTSATFATAGFTDTFVPSPATEPTTTCPTQEASIKITKIDGIPVGAVNEFSSIQPQDDNGIFRIVDCKYMYNLATSSLSGVGTYTIYAEINGVTAANPAVFDLR
jgi:hypothetical protein